MIYTTYGSKRSPQLRLSATLCKYEVFEYVAGRHAVFLDFLLCAACIDIIDDGHLVAMLRSYHHESTRSHQNSEVKRGWARLVLG